MKKTTLEYIHGVLEEDVATKMRIWCEASDEYFDWLNLERSGADYHKKLAELRYTLSDSYSRYTVALYALREFRSENF